MTVDNGHEESRLLGAGPVLACGLASGLLLAASFRYEQLALLAWVALVPLLVSLRKATAPVAIIAGAVYGATFFGILVYWFVIFGSPAVAGILLYGALVGSLFSAGSWWLAGRLPLASRLAGIPALSVILEFVRSSGSWGFSWGMLGYSQQPVPALAQFVSLGGVLGLGAVVALVNVALAEVLLARRKELGALAAAAGVAIACVAGILGWGLWRASVPVPSPAVRIAGVQPSIDQWAKFDPAQADSIMSTLRDLSQEALASDPKLLIWPETVIPLAGEEADLFVGNAAARARRRGTDFLFGSFESNGSRVMNSAVLASAAGDRGVYAKVHLVPFGEYVPLRPLLGNIGMLTLVKNDLTAGKKPVLLRSSVGPVATVICFESSDAPLVREAVSLGARLLVVITNDGWFKRTAASDQHFRVTAMRAIENGLYTVQVSNNGISGVIDPRGRVLARSRLWERRVMIGRVAMGRETTVYSRIGDLPLVLLSAAILLGVATVVRRRPA